MRLIFLTVFLMLSSIAHAANVATSDVTGTTVVKKWHILFDVNHQPVMRDDQFTFTDFTAFFDWQIDKTQSVRILQAATKRYELGLLQGEEEFSPSDTILNHFWNTPYSIGPTRFRWVSVLNIPSSIDSQDSDKILTVGGTLQANTFLNGNFLISVRPYFRYNWYEFKSRPEGGAFLPALLTGIATVLSYSPTDKLSLNATLGYTLVYDYASPYGTSKFGVFGSTAEGRYSVDLSANYSWTDKFGTYIGYSQGDAYIKDGRYELYAYDPLLTRASVGMTFYF